MRSHTGGWQVTWALVALVFPLAVRCGDTVDGGFHARDCTDHKTRGARRDGVYIIYPSHHKWIVFCEGMNTSDVTAWTVIQRRRDGQVNFARSWNQYRLGFGPREADHWVGNDVIHDMTSAADRKYMLRVEVDTWDAPPVHRHADYSRFSVGTETQKYRLHYGAYSGDAGNSLRFHRGMGFSTPDQDNDAWPGANCAAMLRSGWWFNDCGSCNLNGQFHWGLPVPGSAIRSGIWWFGMGDYHNSYRCTMKIRPITKHTRSSRKRSRTAGYQRVLDDVMEGRHFRSDKSMLNQGGRHHLSPAVFDDAEAEIARILDAEQ